MPNIIEITDFSTPELDVYARLTQAQLRNRLEPEKGVFIAESPKVISRALDAGFVPVSLLMERRQLEGQGRDLVERCGQVPVYTGDRAVLAGLTGYELTRGILCAMRRPRLPSVEELCAQPGGGAGGHRGPHQCGGYLPLRRCPAYGRRAGDPHLL